MSYDYYPHDPRAVHRGAPVRPRQQQRNAMYSTMHAPANAGFPGPGRAGMTEMQSFDYPSNLPQYAPHPVAAPMRSPVPSTPDSTITTSSSSADYSDSDVDIDAMVDAAMYESGLLPNIMPSTEHTDLDADLMQEMHDLLSSPRASMDRVLHWEQHESSFHGHQYPPSPTKSPPATPPRDHGVDKTPESPNSEVTDDTDMDEAEPDARGASESDTKELELLMRQLKFLEAQRDFLEYKASLAELSDKPLSAALLHRRDAIEEKKKLMEAQLLHDMLRSAINHQFENLKYVQQQLLESPLTHYRNTLLTPMESYIHLTKDMKERRAVLEGMRDEKLDTAQRFLEFQSRNIDVERDFFFLDSFEKFGKFYTVDFSISKLEDTTVEDVAFVFYYHFVFTKDRIAQILGSVENREYFDGVDWVFLHGRFVDRINLLKRRKHGRNFVVQESNTVFYAAQVGDSFVMTCDSIDKDDLHPYRSTGRIRKDMIFGVVIEPYVDKRGNKSVLLKRFSFFRHHFNNIEPTPELTQAISTKIILWGQAVRMCVSSREKDRLPMPLSRKPLKRAGAPMVLTNW